MSDPREVLQRLAAERERDAQETGKWERYRRLCGPPRWFLLLLVILGLASVALALEALSAVTNHPRLVALGRIGVVIYALVWPPLLLYVESRRRRGLRKILAQEAPELAAKLHDERIL